MEAHFLMARLSLNYNLVDHRAGLRKGFWLLARVQPDLLLDLFGAVVEVVVLKALVLLAQRSFLVQLAVHPNSLADWLVVDVVRPLAAYGPVLELSHVLAPVSEEEVALSVLLEIADLSVVDLSKRIFDLAVANDAVLLPLARDDLARGEDERALAVKLVPQAVADVLIPVDELEVALDLDSVLVHASTSRNRYLKTTPLL